MPPECQLIARHARSLSRSSRAAAKTRGMAEFSGSASISAAACDCTEGAIGVGVGQLEIVVAQPLSNVITISTTGIDFSVSIFSFTFDFFSTSIVGFSF